LKINFLAELIYIAPAEARDVISRKARERVCKLFTGQKQEQNNERIIWEVIWDGNVAERL